MQESASAAAAVCMRDVQARAVEVHKRIAPLLEKLQSGEIQTEQGVSLLEVRLHSLLSYAINVTFLSLLKIHGKSIQNHGVIDRLVELRTVLERTKPLEQKLRYQIDKLVKGAVMHEDSTRLAHDMGDDKGNNAEAGATNIAANALQFKPNPQALMDADDAEDDNADGAAAAEDGLYKPPRLAPMPYDETAQSRRGRLTKQLQERASKSRMLRDLRAQFDDRPEEVDAEGTGYGTRELGVAATKEDSRHKEREAFEEENFIRLTLSKKDKHAERNLHSKGHLLRFQNEFKGLNSDFHDLTGLRRAVDDEDHQRHGEGLVGKRNRRAERMAEASGRTKRARFTDTADMISTLTNVKQHESGKDAFLVQKRTIKKFGPGRKKHSGSSGNGRSAKSKE